MRRIARLRWCGEFVGDVLQVLTERAHLVVGATPDNQIVVRSNGDHEVMRSFGEDLKNVADELEAPPEPGDTTH